MTQPSLTPPTVPMRVPMRVTVHLSPAARALLDGIQRRHEVATTNAAQAERDLTVAALAMAAHAGFRDTHLVDYTERGIVVELAVNLALDQPTFHAEPSE